jgi:predicted small secreted protein
MNSAEFACYVWVRVRPKSVLKQPLRIPAMRATSRLLLLLTILIAAASTLTACNTTAGAGQDLSNTGKAITNAADKAK